MSDLSDTVDTYESVAGEYEKRHRDREVVAELVDRFDDAVDGDRVLDVGCGPGWETATFVERGYDVVAVDLAPSFLARTVERAPAAAVSRADMRQLPVASRSVDGVWACASFLHVPREDAPGTLREFARVLRPGGVLMLSVKEGEGTKAGEAYDGDARQFTLYRAGELRGLVEDSGPSVAWSTAEDGWLAVLARR